jgi:predicted DNA-binding transcriptional regulator YafY
LIGEVASTEVMASYDARRASGRGAVTEAFFGMKRLQIVYLDGQGRCSVRGVEPQVLYLSWPVWYLLAWDDSHSAVRTFRIDRIIESEKKPVGFRLRDERPFLQTVENTGDRL